jgi:hypothetical protein
MNSGVAERRGWLRRIGFLLILFGWLVTPPHPLTGAAAETKRIFTIPPTQWDTTMSRDRQAQIHGPSDLSNLTGGIVFGLSASEVNAKLPTPTPGTEWASLPFANEYPDDVRYFWVRLDSMRALRDAMTGCAGANSYVVFLFHNQSLFRISWRLLPDKDCLSPKVAAEDIYARYLAIDGRVSMATHYQAGNAEVLEISDPNVDYLIPYRWTNRQRR